jgi:cell division protein ZapA
MAQVSIKIKIGDRELPMKVEQAEESILRQAGKNINDKLKKFKEQYLIDDKELLLTMAAFEMAVDELKNEKSTDINDNYFENKLSNIEKLLENV